MNANYRKNGRWTAPLSATHAEIASEWDYSSNGQLTPDNVTAGSGRVVWWKCPNHAAPYQMAVFKRVGSKKNKPNGCSYCHGQKVLPGFNDLKTLSPSIADEWDSSLNGNLSPQDVRVFSNRKVWWKCKHGHSWNASIESRTNLGTGCPFCANQAILVGFNDLGTTHPLLSLDWDYEKNANEALSDPTHPKTPQQVTAGSNKNVYWRRLATYPNGQQDYVSWKLSVKCYTNGIKGPFAKFNPTLVPGFNDLESRSPRLAAEWDYEKNYPLNPSDITLHSKKQKVWWTCPECGHSYLATPDSRANGTGCPRPSMSSFAQEALAFYLRKVFTDVQYNTQVINVSGKCLKLPNRMHVDIYIPSINTAIEVDGCYFHENEKQKINDAKKDQWCKESGIVLVRMIEKRGIEQIKVIDSAPIKIIYPFNLDYSFLSSAINETVHQAERIKGVNPVPHDINVHRDQGEIKKNYLHVIFKNSIASEKKLVAEWDKEANNTLQPSQVTKGSGRKINWKHTVTKNGKQFVHTWAATAASRVKGVGCPYCAGRKVMPGFNDLETTNPKIAKLWHSAKNGQTTAQDVSKGSQQTAWWLCPNCGKEWKASIYSCVSRGGCSCSTKSHE